MGIEGCRPNEGEPSPGSRGESLDTSKPSHGIEFSRKSDTHTKRGETERLSIPTEGRSLSSDSAQKMRDNADKISFALTEVAKTSRPGDIVDPSRVALLESQISLLHERLAITAARETEKDDFLQRLSQTVTTLHSDMANLSQSGGQPVTRTTFEIIGRGVLFATVGAILCGGLGGPAVAFIMHAPVSEKMFEAAIFGALGGAATEVAALLEPSDQGKSRKFNRPASSEATRHEWRAALDDYYGLDHTAEWSQGDDGPAQESGRAR